MKMYSNRRAMFDSFKKLLESVSRILKANKKDLSASEWRFNVFRLCGIDHYEVWHSRILAEFLNPMGTHGFGSAFLDEFLKAAGIQDFPTNDPKTIVRTEFPIVASANENGRLDIIIRNDNRYVIIENKIEAPEGEHQIAKYQQWANERKPAGLTSMILFLTLSGEFPETEAADIPVEVKPISYTETIRVWLGKCIQIASCRPFVRETLRQYLNLIKQLTGQSMENDCTNEIRQLLGDGAEEPILSAALQLTASQNCIFEQVGRRIADEIKRRMEEVPSFPWMFESEEIEGSYNAENQFLFVKNKRFDFTVRIASDATQYKSFYVGPMTQDVSDHLRQRLESASKNGRGWKTHSSWPIYKYLSKSRRWDVHKLLSFMNGNREIVDEVIELLRELDQLISNE